MNLSSFALAFDGEEARNSAVFQHASIKIFGRSHGFSSPRYYAGALLDNFPVLLTKPLC